MKKIFITGEIDLRKYEEIAKYLTDGEKYDKIVIFINSGGGSIDVTFAIYDLIKSLNKRVTTVVLGKCYSMATVLFSLGQERYIGKNAKYMLHQTNINVRTDTSFPSGEIVEIARNLEKEESVWKKMLIENVTTLKAKEIVQEGFKTKEDKYFAPREIVNSGLATALLENMDEVII